jgi:hypothetical protein
MICAQAVKDTGVGLLWRYKEALKAKVDAKQAYQVPRLTHPIMPLASIYYIYIYRFVYYYIIIY